MRGRRRQQYIALVPLQPSSWFWQTEVAEVYAEIGQNLLHRNLSVDDAGLLSFTLANGIYGTLDTSWSRPPSYPTWGDVKLELTAERGVVWVDALQQHIHLAAESAGKTQWIHYGSNMDDGLIGDFIHTIRTGAEPSISGQDGLKTLEVALAAYRSAAPTGAGHASPADRCITRLPTSPMLTAKCT